MSEATPTYSAQLMLKLPGGSDETWVTVPLAPADLVPLSDHVKPLSECTLADLQRFGAALEADIWQTYEQITLLELHEDRQVEIQLAKLDDSGAKAEEVSNWQAQIVLLAGPDEASEKAPDGDLRETRKRAAKKTAKPVAAQPDEAKQATAPEPAPETPAAPKPVAQPELREESAPAVVISEEKPAEDSAPPKAAPVASETTPIIPSKARVRVAGRRLPAALAMGAAVHILLDEAPLRAMQAHALSSLDREVAGVMIGPRPEKQPDGRYLIHIIDSIAAKHTVMQGASVTYTPESWRYLNDTLAERYPDESAVMVGWYHTHPGFGIFLSNMDLFIHQNFFTQLWHIAYVLDPRARNSGFFCWNREKTRVQRYDFPWPDWAEGAW